MANVALIANIADQTAAARTGTTASLVPSGVIFPYAGSTTPTGWIVCDGTAYKQTDYPELFAALGSTYNTQVNPTTGVAWAAPSAGQFRVPDMRGLFLRGEGTASGGDAVSLGGHQVGKTAKNGLTASAAASAISALTMNSSAITALTLHNTDLSHSHQLYGRDYHFAGVGGRSGFARGTDTSSNTNDSTINTSISMSHAHSLSSGTAAAQTISSGTAAAQTVTVGAGDNETRPVNRGVRYIIKV